MIFLRDFISCLALKVIYLENKVQSIRMTSAMSKWNYNISTLKLFIDPQVLMWLWGPRLLLPQLTYECSTYLVSAWNWKGHRETLCVFHHHPVRITEKKKEQNIKIISSTLINRWWWCPLNSEDSPIEKFWFILNTVSVSHRFNMHCQ